MANKVLFYYALIICTIHRKYSNTLGLWRIRNYCYALSSKYFKKDYYVNFIGDKGIRLSANLKDYNGQRLFINGSCEPEIIQYIDSLNLEDGVVLDIGANLGFLSLYFAKTIAKNGQVFAYEADPRTYNELTRNIKLNSLNNIKAYNTAVSDQEGTALFYLNTNHSGTSSLFNLNYTNEPITIQTIKLDNYIDQFNRINLIKIDVEGAELKVLLGLQDIILKFKPLIIFELIDRQLEAANTSSKEVIQKLLDFGYQIKKIGSNGLNEIDYKETKSGNYLASFF